MELTGKASCYAPALTYYFTVRKTRTLELLDEPAHIYTIIVSSRFHQPNLTWRIHATASTLDPRTFDKVNDLLMPLRSHQLSTNPDPLCTSVKLEMVNTGCNQCTRYWGIWQSQSSSCIVFITPIINSTRSPLDKRKENTKEIGIGEYSFHPVHYIQGHSRESISFLCRFFHPNYRFYRTPPYRTFLSSLSLAALSAIASIVDCFIISAFFSSVLLLRVFGELSPD